MLHCPENATNKADFTTHVTVRREQSSKMACTGVIISRAIRLFPQDCPHVFFVLEKNGLHAIETPHDLSVFDDEKSVFTSLMNNGNTCSTNNDIERLLTLYANTPTPYHAYLLYCLQTCSRDNFHLMDVLRISYHTPTEKCHIKNMNETAVKIIIPRKECVPNTTETRDNALLKLFGLHANLDVTYQQNAVHLSADGEFLGDSTHDYAYTVELSQKMSWFSPRCVHIHGSVQWLMVKFDLLKTGLMLGDTRIPHLLGLISLSDLRSGSRRVGFVQTNPVYLELKDINHEVQRVNVQITNLNGDYINFAPTAQAPVLFLDFQ